MGDAVIQEPGEQFRVVYPAVAFFESFSLSTLRCVPLNSASVIADLYSVRSCALALCACESTPKSLVVFYSQNGATKKVAEIFQTAVTTCDFFGGAGREQELVLLTADIDNGTSVVIHALPPLSSAV